MFEVQFVEHWTCSCFFRGFVFDKDGCLLASERLIRQQILDTALMFAGAREFAPDVVAAATACLGQPDDQMSIDLWKVLRKHFPGGPIAQVPQDDFVGQFAEARVSGWRLRALNGTLVAKEGALRLLDRVRRGEYFTAMYTGMPVQMAVQAIDLVLHATDQFSGETLVTCSDPRLDGLGKPHPRGWEVLARLASDTRQINPKELVAVEDRATGAVGALKAGYGAVVVVPDPDDVPLDQWDRRGLIEAHLLEFPEDRKKLFFLRSLLDISFA